MITITKFQILCIGLIIGSASTGYINFLNAADALENSNNGALLEFSESRIYKCERINITDYYLNISDNNVSELK